MMKIQPHSISDRVREVNGTEYKGDPIVRRIILDMERHLPDRGYSLVPVSSDVLDQFDDANRVSATFRHSSSLDPIAYDIARLNDGATIAVDKRFRPEETYK